MYNSDTNLLFPTRVIPSLRELRGQPWKDLVDRVMAQETGTPGVDQLAFVLMMVRLGGCTSCQADSFRALQGCTLCARQTVRRYRGNDEDLAALFARAQKDIERMQQKKFRSSARKKQKREN